MLKLIGKVGVFLSVLMLASCTSVSKSIVENYTKLRGSNAPSVEAALNPEYRYMRITLSGRTTFVLLGDIDPHPDGPIEIYYSSVGEVLRFQQGRLVGASGLLTEWRDVTLKGVPSWSSLNSQGFANFSRTRDEMPGYGYGVQELITSRKVSPPLKSALFEVPPESLIWFEERVLPHGNDSEALPPSRYGIAFEGSLERVVYGEQCLSHSLCLTWQPWAPRKK